MAIHPVRLFLTIDWHGALFAAGLSRHPAAIAVMAACLMLPGCVDDAGAGSNSDIPQSADSPAAVVLASDIPIAHTPPGGYGAVFPQPVLTTCTEPLVAEAPDLRGMWKTDSAVRDGQPVPPDDAVYQHFQRIEQCGDRLVVTAGGVIHDMRCDGTEANGVHDVAEFDFTTPITVVATYEAGVHVLRPVGIPVEVTRRLDGSRLVWSYLGLEVRLVRIGGPDAPPPVN
jgi:hypothetical protein